MSANITTLNRPPFTRESALQTVKAVEAAWNTRDPKRVALSNSADCHWRNRDENFEGRLAIETFLTRKWSVELQYRLQSEMWAFSDHRISVRLGYEWRHVTSGRWYRTYGNEHWEFDDSGLMCRRDVSANDIPIEEHDRVLC